MSYLLPSEGLATGLNMTEAARLSTHTAQKAREQRRANCSPDTTQNGLQEGNCYICEQR